jgi:putative acetyltransferase
MQIEPEAPHRESAIRALLLEAFPTAVEADLVEQLRRDGDLVISRAAIVDESVVGYAALSRMTAPMRALGLGPLAVTGGRQRQGIGASLIRKCIADAKAAGWQAIFVLGDPAYYGRFGFSTSAAERFETPYAGPYFMVLSLSAEPLVGAGRIDYAPAFRDLE